jgi:hypothetical protein
MFNFNPTDGLNNEEIYPQKPTSGSAARQQFMDLFNQLKDYVNTLALSSHTHSNYAASGHTHSNYLSTTGTAANTTKVNGKTVFIQQSQPTATAAGDVWISW